MNSNRDVTISLRWKPSDHLPSIYVNQLRVVHTNNEFYLIFGEVDPVTLDIDVDNPPEYLDVRPVVKLAVSPARMPNFVEVLRKNLQKFVDTHAMREDTEQ